jgi:uncharacterized protein (DUF305 family)
MAFAVALISTGCGTPSSPAGAKTVAFDQQFMEMMVPHHEGAVEMARIADQRSQRPEIRTMAADILRTQASAIQWMKAWRKACFGNDQTSQITRMSMVDGMQMPASGGHDGHGGSASPSQTMDMAADVEKMRAASEPFDRVIIVAMIPHHQDAVEASKSAASRAQHEEIETLSREIDALRQWRQAWFPG